MGLDTGICIGMESSLDIAYALGWWHGFTERGCIGMGLQGVCVDGRMNWTAGQAFGESFAWIAGWYAAQGNQYLLFGSIPCFVGISISTSVRSQAQSPSAVRDIGLVHSI